MTMDLVAVRAKAGKATVYRRWPSKGQLVLDAITRMGHQEVDLDRLPDTARSTATSWR
jgi:AcrR family transcriptional regulator